MTFGNWTNVMLFETIGSDALCKCKFFSVLDRSMCFWFEFCYIKGGWKVGHVFFHCPACNNWSGKKHWRVKITQLI